MPPSDAFYLERNLQDWDEEDHSMLGFLYENFRELWEEILERLEAGEDFGEAYEHEFLAPRRRDRVRYARRYYSVKNARELLALDREALFERLVPWLAAAKESEWWWYDRDTDALATILVSPYVMVVKGDRPDVGPYPGGLAGYDDLYERAASGVSSGADFWLCKTILAPFTEAEARHACTVLEREFFDVCASEEDPERWRFAAGREEHDPRWIHGGVWQVDPEQEARDAAVFGELDGEEEADEDERQR